LERFLIRTVEATAERSDSGKPRKSWHDLRVIISAARRSSTWTGCVSEGITSHAWAANQKRQFWMIDEDQTTYVSAEAETAGKELASPAVSYRNSIYLLVWFGIRA
jgi:hypothetical protein